MLSVCQGNSFYWHVCEIGRPTFPPGDTRCDEESYPDFLTFLLKSVLRACLVNLFGYSHIISLGDQVMRPKLGRGGGQPRPGLGSELHLSHQP